MDITNPQPLDQEPTTVGKVVNWTVNLKELNRASKRVAPGEFDTHQMNNLAVTMITTMKQHDSLGIAAPQLGIRKRIIAILYNNLPIVMVNPTVKVVMASDLTPEEFTIEEGCISCPDVFLQADFPKEVIVKYQDRAGNQNQLQLTGVFAAVLMHNINLLDGVLFIDDVKGDERNRLKLVSSEYIRKNPNMFIHNSTQLKKQQKELAL